MSKFVRNYTCVRWTIKIKNLLERMLYTENGVVNVVYKIWIFIRKKKQL